MPRAPRIVVYSREGCHLCDVALAVVEHVAVECDEDFSVVDIDKEGLAEFSDLVPVIAVDRKVVSRWRISPELLRAALARSPEV